MKRSKPILVILCEGTQESCYANICSYTVINNLSCYGSYTISLFIESTLKSDPDFIHTYHLGPFCNGSSQLKQLLELQCF